MATEPPEGAPPPPPALAETAAHESGLVLSWLDAHTTRDQAWAINGGIGVGAALGTLARYGMAELSRPSTGGAIVPDLLPNFVGCFFMGLVVALKSRLQPPHPTIYAGGTTGFCGCCTTFSAYNAAVAQLFLDAEPLQALLCLMVGTAAAAGGLRMGMSVSSMMFIPPASPADPPVPQSPAGDLRDPAQWIRPKLLVYWGLLFTAAVTAAALFASHLASVLLIGVCVAPSAAWIRFYASKGNLPDKVPWRTLACNTAACAISALIAALNGTAQCTGLIDDAPTRRVLAGLSLGFAGGLSTVSTLTDECRRVAARHQPQAWAYFGLSVLLGQLVAISALLPTRWAKGCLG